MDNMKLGVIESRFADLIWEHEPLTTGELVELCSWELNWKRTTTYTVLRKLSERGLFQNDRGTVTSLVSRQEYYALQGERFVEEAFSGSLPAFLTAFTSRKKLSEEELEALQRLIDQSRG